MLLEDIRYGVRSIVRSPLLSCATILTLALGIGINTGVFTILNGMLFRARVGSHPESFVHLSPDYSGESASGAEAPWAISVAGYRAYAAAHSIDKLAAWGVAHAALGRDNPTPVLALLVSCNFFSVYGLDQLSFGRLFRDEECATPGTAPVVVLSEEIWRDRFASDPQILGTLVILNRRPFTVVGIAPAGFAGRLRGPGIWIPYTMQAPFFGGVDLFRSDAPRWLTVEGRLKPGVSRTAARAELAVIAHQQDALHPGRKTAMLLTNGSIAEEPSMRAQVVWTAPLIMGALTLILLLACTNVTTLLLSRAAARRREIAIRLSLGAGRARLLRMLITESLILAAAAGAISAYVAWQMPAIFLHLAGTGPNYPVQPDLLVFGYLAAVTLAAGAIAGAAPAAESLNVDLTSALKGQESLLGQRHSRNFLVGAQVAMSMVLLVIAGIFVHAQYTIFTASPGFETHQVLMVGLHTDMPPYTAESAAAFDRAVAQRVAALSGVVSVAFTGAPPFSASDEGAGPTEEINGTRQPAAVNTVSENYFDTLGIPLVRGRAFRPGDPRAIVVSEAFARAFFPGRDAIGQTVQTARGEPLEVAGVARDVKSQRFGATDGPLFYRPRPAQAFGDTLMVRFRGEEGAIAAAVRSAIREMDREQMPAPGTLQALMDQAADRFWRLSQMVLFLGAVAVLLAVVGIYGVAAFAVTRRTREMGIRIALGATRRDIVQAVLESGMRPVLMGLAAGVALSLMASLALGRVLRQMPFALDVRDPLAYGAVALLLALAALAATLGPALRAAKADPTWALRQE